MFKINKESDVPVPMAVRLSHRGAPIKYPFSEMEVGDSFFVPCKPEEGSKMHFRLQRASAKWRARARKQSTYFSGMYTSNGYRLWRVK